MRNEDIERGVLGNFSLASLEIVDAPPEETFDELTKLAQSIFAAPVALVSIVEVDKDRQYFKSQQGLPEPWAGQRQTPLSHSFCRHVVANDKPLVVENARSNSLVCDNLAIRDLNVVAYLGVPIYDPNQEPIGSLCVIDGRPREWSAAQVRNLQQLGRCVSDAIRLKAAIKTSELLREHERGLSKDLEKSNEALEQFACVAAHDLQEPLRKITSFGNLINEECSSDLSAEGASYLNCVVDAASRMQTLIQDLLEFSQIQSQGNGLTDVSVAEALEAALFNLQAAIDESNAVITMDPLPTVVADSRQLTQLLQNLISNGIKYCRDNATIHIGVKEAQDEFVISVKDNGIGIAPKFHEQIFGIFKRLHGRGKFSGTGIGLAICKRITNSWQQRIWVQSTEGSGTTFFFSVAKSSLENEDAELVDGVLSGISHG